MKKIFVVDDDEEILEVVQLALAIDNYHVKAVTKWEEINEVLGSFLPDLVLLDISLSGADGRDICKKLKTSAAHMHIPVILFSANPEMGREYKNYGAHDFIAKPFELMHLLDTVKANMG